jgi:serine/threonine protein phosphatase 1
MPDVVYAIGDVHGQLPLLRMLEQKIAEDAENFSGEKWIVLLGDFVDRGPASAQVLDHLVAAPKHGLTRYCLAGNHEIMMLDALEGRCPTRQWMELGGLETLSSYGISARDLGRTPASSPRFRYLLDSHIPTEHIEFLRDLPVAIDLPGFLFVHAGARLDIPLSQQTDKELTLVSDHSGVAGKEDEKIVVHGHRIVEKPTWDKGNINVDTGAYLTGRLTAARLVSGRDAVFLQTNKNNLRAAAPLQKARS